MNVKKKSLGTLLAWLVWAIAVLYYLYEYIQRIAPSLIVPNLMQSFHLDTAALGNLSAIYFYSYALCQVPVGIIADRYGPKRPLFYASILCTIGSILFASTTILGLAQLGRGLIGVGSAFGYICCLRIIINWFPEKRFGFMCGLVNTVGLLGALLGDLSLNHFLAHSDWRSILLSLSIIGCFISVLIFLIVKDFPKKRTNDVAILKTAGNIKGVLTPLVRVVKCRHVWIAGLYVGGMYCTYDTLAALWGVPYIQSIYHINKLHAAEMSGLIFLGGAVGYLFFGALISRFQNMHKMIMITAATSILLTALCLYQIPQNMALVEILFFSLGFFTGANCVVTDLVKSYMPREMSGLTLGFVNFMLVSIGAISQPLFGYLLQSGHGYTDHLSAFGTADYQRAFLLLPTFYVTSLLCALFIKQVKKSSDASS